MTANASKPSTNKQETQKPTTAVSNWLSDNKTKLIGVEVTNDANSTQKFSYILIEDDDGWIKKNRQDIQRLLLRRYQLSPGRELPALNQVDSYISPEGPIHKKISDQINQYIDGAIINFRGPTAFDLNTYQPIPKKDTLDKLITAQIPISYDDLQKACSDPTKCTYRKKFLHWGGLDEYAPKDTVAGLEARIAAVSHLLFEIGPLAINMLKGNPADKFYYYDGKGGDGKSTKLDFLRECMGSDLARPGNTKDIFDQPNKFSPQIGGLAYGRDKLLLTYDENNDEGNLRFKLDTIKQLTVGGQPVDIRLMHRNSESYTGYATVMVAANTLVNVNNTNDSIIRRFIVIEMKFNYQSNIDLDLPAKLREHIPCFWRDVVTIGAKYYQKNGYKLTKKIKQTTNKYFKTQRLIEEIAWDWLADIRDSLNGQHPKTVQRWDKTTGEMVDKKDAYGDIIYQKEDRVYFNDIKRLVLQENNKIANNQIKTSLVDGGWTKERDGVGICYIAPDDDHRSDRMFESTDDTDTISEVDPVNYFPEYFPEFKNNKPGGKNE